ncbi:MAG TPA: sialidase family protein, partial [Mycobacterium sp.]|nr:sialidase family protein [Mycobacterium sp.]
VLASGNRGASWHPARRGLRAYTTVDVASDPHQQGSLWIAVPMLSDFFRGVVYPGLFHTVDGGRTWAASGRGFDPHSYAVRIVLDPVRPERLYALTYPEGLFHRSTDGGANWQVMVAPNAFSNLLVVDPESPDTLYASGTAFPPDNEEDGSPAIVKSVDGGETWADLSGGFETGTGDRPFSGLTIHPDRPATLYASCTAGFFRSRTAGRRWQRLANGESTGVNGPLVIDPLDTARMFAFGGTDQDHQLIKSTDRGVTWQPTSLETGSSQSSVLVADPHRRGTFYAVASYLGKPFVTDDDGAIWRPLATGLGPTPRVVTLGADLHVPGRLYLSFLWSGLFTLTRR